MNFNQNPQRPDLFASAQALILDYWELTKPRLVSLVLLSAFVGFYLGSPQGMNVSLLFSTLLGALLVSAGSMALNEWMEKDTDALMERTRTRPLPSGRVEPIEALGFGCVLSLIGFGVLEITVNTTASIIAALTWGSYLFLYTPLKRKSHLSTYIGAIPGALPPLIGWAAVQPLTSAGIWTVFAIMLFWQLPHFFAISWIYKEDYRNAGLQVLSVVRPNAEEVAKWILAYSVLLFPISLSPFFLGVTGNLYLFGAIILNALFLAIAWRGVRSLDENCKILFRSSVVYLSLIFLLMLVDKQ